MAKTIAAELIQLADHAPSYQSAISLACEPLIREGYIEPSYVDRIFDALATFGPYIILADEFALPHAPPGDDVLKTGVSLLVLKQPVDLLGQPVRFLMVLAATNSSDHIETLESLAHFLMEPESLLLLTKCETVTQIHHLLEERWTT